MSGIAQNTPLDNAQMVTIPLAQLDRLKAQYSQLRDEKVQMERDISVLMFIGRKLMSLFQGKNLMKSAMDIMKNPQRHKAEFADLEGLFLKYQHLMPNDPTDQRLLGASDGN
ncbi:hypothetical protein [Fibrella forsythiae]|uniref:Uncharacterized protein n=1 Tax=Fibrella forsythiae TaxID=2817061 RepID=A0ABS3JAG4_9BACT|nr:hypothetical protein [Fibrella forsythiae]MBO0946987.1 hypothetical protein [Fibrella forsythiae]